MNTNASGMRKPRDMSDRRTIMQIALIDNGIDRSLVDDEEIDFSQCDIGRRIGYEK